MRVVACLFAIVVCLMLCASFAVAQSQPTNIYAFGVSGNPSGSPMIGGTGMWAHLLKDGTGTYAFTVVDALPQSYKPFTVNTNVGAGVAQKVFTIGGKVPLYCTGGAGISFNGSNTGWSWNGGCLAPLKVKKNSSFFLAPTARFVKSSISNGTGYQGIFTIMLGWGQ